MPTPPIHDHVIEFVDGAGTAAIKRIAASYFTPEEELMLFKDSDHKMVFAVRLDRLVCVERGRQLDGSEEPQVG